MASRILNTLNCFGDPQEVYVPNWLVSEKYQLAVATVLVTCLATLFVLFFILTLFNLLLYLILFLSDEGPMLETLDYTILYVLAVHRPFYISIYLISLFEFIITRP